MADHSGRRLPPGHVAFRSLIAAVLAASALAAGLSDGVAGAVSWTRDRDARLTRYLWRPLLHGGGWAAPVLPPRPDRPQPSPSAVPVTKTAQPAATKR